MSDILIRGMEMPTSCMACLFQNPYMGGWCYLLNDNSNAYSRRRDCPLIPVPPHGRLIDADKEMARVKRLYDNAVDKDPEMGCVNVYEGEIAVLQLAPTIIPASFENLPKTQDSRKITNADRIRDMDSDQLAEWFCQGRPCGTCPYCGNFECSIRDWLKEERE